MAKSLNSHGSRFDCETETFVVGTLQAGKKSAGSATQQDAESDLLVTTHTLRAQGFDASEDGTGRGIPLTICPLTRNPYADNESRASLLVPIAIQERAISENPDAGPVGAGFRQDDQAYTLEARPLEARPRPQAIAFPARMSGTQFASAENICPSMGAANPMAIAQLGMSVRRLTPRECERLQGFPDDYTLVTYRKKPSADGPRYCAIGNSMAVPVMRWLGERIQMVEDLVAC